MILYSNETVLNSGISAMIENTQEMSLTVVPASDIDHLVKISQGIQPDVVLIENSILTLHKNLLYQLLDGIKDLRVITLDQYQNLLHVYTRHDVSVKRASDLILAIRSRASV